MTDPTRRRHAWLAVGLAAALLAGCGGQAEEPQTLPSATSAPEGPQSPELPEAPELEPAAPPPLPPPIRKVEPESRERELVRMISDGSEIDPQPETLIEASRLAKAKKQERQKASVEINDENLHEYAEGGQVIIMESPPAASPASSRSRSGSPNAGTPDAGGSSADGSLEDRVEALERDEAYWRTRGLEIRRRWRQAVDELEEVELEAAALRQRFYAEDDPYVRDGRIKPAWDRALDRISELEREILQHQDELDTFLAEGRAAGAQPGWLREGWELEPERREPPDPGEGIEPPAGEPDDLEVIEPPTIN